MKTFHPDRTLQRNLPDLASSLPRLPMSPTSQHASYPLVDERLSSERPPWEPRTRFEMEKEITDLKVLQHRLGDSVSWIVDALLLDEGSTDGQLRATSIKERKREAVECLSYVRDVLKGTVPATQIEGDRLVGDEELKVRKQKELEQQAAASLARPETGYPSASLALPQPAATAPPSTQSQPSATRRSQDYFTISPSLTRTPVKATPIEVAHARAPSPTPTVSVLTPNTNAVPLAPWNYTRSMFSPRDLPLPPPRMPSRPSAVASVRPAARPHPSAEDAPPRQQPPAREQDPLGVLR